MFEDCVDFKYIEIFWPDFSKVININYIFKNCKNIKNINILSEWNIENVKSMIGLFYGYSSLESLPDISNWDLSNVTNISGIFNGCSSLKEIPDISK